MRDGLLVKAGIVGVEGSQVVVPDLGALDLTLKQSCHLLQLTVRLPNFNAYFFNFFCQTGCRLSH